MAIKLGGGGGSASQVNEVVNLNDSANTVTLDDGRVYLKGGVFETNTSTYPDATSSLQYTGTEFIVAQDNNITGIAWDGTHFWAVGRGNDSVYKYNSSGVYQNVSFNVSSQMSNPVDIVSRDTFLHVIESNGSNSKTYQYGNNVYQNTNFSVASQDIYPQGIAWDGTYFWVIGQETSKVYKYNSSGVYQNVNFSVLGTDQYQIGITYDGTNLWTLSANTHKMYKYNTSGVYQNVAIDISYSGTSPTGLVWDGTSFRITYSNSRVRQYANGIGIQSNADITTDGQNYVRVK
jgi:hypothetical protein